MDVARVRATVSSVSGRGTVAIVVAALSLALEPSHQVVGQRRPCQDSPNVPLTDLTTPYRGLEPGLYPGGATVMPEEHRARGLAQAARVRPLDAGGVPSPRGRILLVSIGMSNTRAEFAPFAAEASRHPSVNRRLTIVNAALSGADAPRWLDADGPAWRHTLSAVHAVAGASPAQVQVIWLKQARLRTLPFPVEIEAFAADLSATIRIAREVFPNLKIVYLSSRTRSGAETRRGPAEPQAYESGFAVRRVVAEWMMAPGSRDAREPWVGWGPYLWARESPRSDGLSWACSDLQEDLLHPSVTGEQKVAEQLMAFFMSAETAAQWFLDPARAARRSVTVTSSSAGGAAPLTVSFTSQTGRAEHFWSFGDGTTSRSHAPRKRYERDGTFRVQLTAVQRDGTWTRGSASIDVGTRP